MSEKIEKILAPKTTDLGEFSVRRVLPSAQQKMVGPFVFFDHMGPVDFQPGQGVSVRPHPHIGISTVTYLFEGEIMHRDSLGYEQPIQAGAVNWMTAGRGIVHSERSRPELVESGSRLHGIQSWVALPLEHEETEPAFTHYPADELPSRNSDGLDIRLIAGEILGLSSRVKTHSPLFYADVVASADSVCTLGAEYTERAVYPVAGDVEIDGGKIEINTMAVLAPGADVEITASSDSRYMLAGGEPLEGKRTVWWNFVSSRPERIEQAKQDWQAGNFEAVPGETEFIPLPDN